MRSLGPRGHAVVLLFIALSTAPPFVHAGNENCQDCLTVVGIVGVWKQLDPPSRGKLSFAQKITPDRGLKVACDEGTLVLLRGEKATAFHCPASGPIQAGLPDGTKYTVEIPSVPGAQSGWRIALAFAGPMIEHVTPVSRGLEGELNDAVVPIKGDSIDLTAAFQGMDSGNYLVQLEPVSGGKATVPVQVKWADGTSASVAIPGLRPGLYKLARLDANGQLAGPEAWILVSRPEDFEKDRSAFQEALDATKKWPDEVDVRAPRAFLRQVLDGLSRQPAR